MKIRYFLPILFIFLFLAAILHFAEPQQWDNRNTLDNAKTPSPLPSIDHTDTPTAALTYLSTTPLPESPHISTVTTGANNSLPQISANGIDATRTVKLGPIYVLELPQGLQDVPLRITKKEFRLLRPHARRNELDRNVYSEYAPLFLGISVVHKF